MSEPKTYRNPVPTVDIIIELDGGGIVLIERKNEPRGWALPGGFMNFDESASDAIVREVHEETGVKVRPLKIIGVFSDPKRDPRQTVAIALFCEPVFGIPTGGDDAEDAKWWNLYRLPPLAFDHAKIIKTALEQL